MSDARTWKRRERALAAGIVLWAVAVSAFIALRPGQASDAILAAPLQVAGGTMVSIGLAGGLCESLILAADRYATTDESSDLTDVPWEDDNAE